MSAEFIAEEGVLKGLILSLRKGDEWVMGRDPDQCSIVLEDPEVSRVHFKVRKSAEGYSVENLSQSHPVKINGQEIQQPTFLHDNDRLQIGGTLFEFFSEGSPDEDVFNFQFEDADTSPLESSEEEMPLESLSEEEPRISAEEADESISNQEDIFQEDEFPEFSVDLAESTRFLLKVIAGPNTGAEFSLDLGKSYLIGTDTTTCDIVFNDLSVSREHARLELADAASIYIEDLSSRNGVIVNHERIEGKQPIGPNVLVAVGTSVFLLIDKEAASETIASSIFEPPEEEKEVVEALEETLPPEPVVVAPKRPLLPMGTLLLSLMIAGLIVLFGVGAVSLFQAQPIEIAPRNYQEEIGHAIAQFPALRFTFNPVTGKLFIMGHVLTGVEKSELLYKLQGLTFIKGIEDNVVNDEAVWQETNILLSKYPAFKGVSLHSPEPGVFVLSGYLETEAQAADLIDYMNIHFNYISLLQNRVVVAQEVIAQVTSNLIQKKLTSVTPNFSNGDLILTGYVYTTQSQELEEAVTDMNALTGIRSVKNYVVSVIPPPPPPKKEGKHRDAQGNLVDAEGNIIFDEGEEENSPIEGIVDLNKKYPGRYRVTGYSKHGDVNINVVINGKIYTRGDLVDEEFTLISIQPHTIFLEKDGLKYKIEYNR